MNKQELQNKIEDLEKQLAELKKEVNSVEDESVKKNIREYIEHGQVYFYLDSAGNIQWTEWEGNEADLFRHRSGNIFLTKEETEDFKENILTKQALKGLALELNNGVEIDWKDKRQNKYVVSYSNDFEILTFANSYHKDLGQIYCLDNQFLTIAKDRISEEKIIKLIKSGV